MRYRKLLLITFFILFGLISQNYAQTNNSLSITQSEGLEFDKKETFLLCPSDTQFGLDREEPIVEVTTKILEQSQKFKYRYSVSGGRVVGTGAKVIWDLNKMSPGLYKLTVNVRGEKSRRKFVKEIRLNVPPHCSIPCLCPTLSIISPPESIQDGKTAIFIAQVRGGSQNVITYKWTVRSGNAENKG